MKIEREREQPHDKMQSGISYPDCTFPSFEVCYDFM